MNILFLTSWFPSKETPWRGIFVKNQAKVVSEHFKVIVLVFEINNFNFSPFFKYDTEVQSHGNMIVYRVTVDKSFPIYNQINFLLSVFYILSRVIRKHKIQIIHSHVSYPAGFIARIVHYIYNIPYLITEHMGPIESLFRSPIHKWMVISALKKAKVIIAVSNAAKKRIVKYTSSTIRVVPNFIDPKKFRLSASAKKVKNIGFLGGLNNKKKNLDVLLNAFAKLQNKNLTLHIGGTGKLLPYYQQMSKELGIHEKCIFYGGIPPDQLVSFYSKIDLFVLPSKFESFGIVGIEALASGIPVISIKHAGPEDYINDLNGILVEPGNIMDLKQAIEKVLKSYTSYKPDRIRQYIIENFSPECFIQQIIPIYKSLVKENQWKSQ